MATYEILVKNETQGSSEGYESSFPDFEAPLSGGSTEKQTDSSSAGTLKTMAKVWAGTALVRQVFTWQLSLVGRNTGSTDLQQKINSALSIGGQALGIASAFAVGGPAAGAMATAAVGLSYLQQAEQYGWDKKWEGYALQEAYRRAGPSFNRSRV